MFCGEEFSKKKIHKLYEHIKKCHREPDERPGWIYCVSDGSGSFYKCGMIQNKQTRKDVEKYLISKYNHAYPLVQIHHIVSSANPKYELSSLTCELDEFHINRNFFMVDDVSIIVNAMDDLVLG